MKQCGFEVRSGELARMVSRLTKPDISIKACQTRLQLFQPQASISEKNYFLVKII